MSDPWLAGTDERPYALQLAEAFQIAALPLLAAAVEQRVVDARAEALREFTQWVASNRAYNGSDCQHGQSLYNECLNGVLPPWVEDWLADRGQA